MRGRILGILVLLAWGIAKFSFEARLEQRMENTRLGGFKPTASLRQQAGQAGFIAALGGLRSAVADLLWIRAYTAWRDVQYGRMKLLFDTCTAMQPRRVLFWDISAWHMAWNGAAYVQNHEPDPVVRKAEMRKFFMAGKDFLQRGIESNPDSWELYERLGALYKDKLKDFENASKAYDEASKRPAVFHRTTVPWSEPHTRSGRSSPSRSAARRQLRRPSSAWGARSAPSAPCHSTHDCEPGRAPPQKSR
jgi:hypothetical protein